MVVQANKLETSFTEFIPNLPTKVEKKPIFFCLDKEDHLHNADSFSNLVSHNNYYKPNTLHWG
jgi:hypothetical protein